MFDRITDESIDFNEEIIRRYMIQIVSAVEYLHGIGIAHRDLKPENIMFESKSLDSTLKLIDFGYSKKTDENLETPVGTVAYVAPEVITTNHYDKAVDLWSLGCILYFMFVKYCFF